MDNRSPRSRELLGPRPTPLKIRKDSHKITKKPPLPQQPPLQVNQQEPVQQPPPRGPVIIYTVSPKIIHTDPNDFMTLVQRLTGKTSTSSTLPSSSASTSAPNDTSAAFDASRGTISPAARFAATEKANNSNELGFVGGLETTDQYHYHRVNERTNCYHGGILYPGPTSMQSISPEFFAPVGQTDPQGLSSYFNDFSSILQSNTSTTPSPSFTDLFNNFFDS